MEELEIKLFWKRPNDYEWQVRDSDNATIATGRAESIVKALAAGKKKAKRLTKLKLRRSHSMPLPL